MNHTRPKNLNLFTIHFPLPAIISILHRVSGFFLFLLIPFLLWSLDFSLTLTGFETIQQWFDHFYMRVILWLILIPFCFHLLAGCRHLLMDIHIGETLKGGRKSALLVFIFSFLSMILVGIWLW